MRNPALFLAGTHTPPSEVSFRTGSTFVLFLSVLHLCPSRSKTETLSETGWLPRVVQGEAFRHLCRCSRRAESAA